jgi:hypothetical protein
MNKYHKNAGACAAIVVAGGLSAMPAVRAGVVGPIRDKVGIFLFGGRVADNPVTKQCLKDALATYRADLKTGRDAFVGSQKDLRFGYKDAVNYAANDLRNADRDDKGLWIQKKKELKDVRRNALKDWGGNLKQAHDDWDAARENALNSYRTTREKCLDD